MTDQTREARDPRPRGGTRLVSRVSRLRRRGVVAGHDRQRPRRPDRTAGDRANSGADHHVPHDLASPADRKRRAVYRAILFLRTMAVEPFGVPTGSMAPTLSGNHRAADLPTLRLSRFVSASRRTRQNAYPGSLTAPIAARSTWPLRHATDFAAIDCSSTRTYSACARRGDGKWRSSSARRISQSPTSSASSVCRARTIQLQDGDVWINGATGAQDADRKLANARCRSSTATLRRRAAGTSTLARRRHAFRRLGSAKPTPLPEWLTLSGNDLHIAARARQSPVSPLTGTCRWTRWTPEVIRDGFEYNGHGSPTHDYPVHDFLRGVRSRSAGRLRVTVVCKTDRRRR